MYAVVCLLAVDQYHVMQVMFLLVSKGSHSVLLQQILCLVAVSLCGVEVIATKLK